MERCAQNHRHELVQCDVVDVIFPGNQFKGNQIHVFQCGGRGAPVQRTMEHRLRVRSDRMICVLKTGFNDSK